VLVQIKLKSLSYSLLSAFKLVQSLDFQVRATHDIHNSLIFINQEIIPCSIGVNQVLNVVIAAVVVVGNTVSIFQIIKSSNNLLFFNKKLYPNQSIIIITTLSLQ
jgi:hypothetical protein